MQGTLAETGGRAEGRRTPTPRARKAAGGGGGLGAGGALHVRYVPRGPPPSRPPGSRPPHSWSPVRRWARDQVAPPVCESAAPGRNAAAPHHRAAGPGCRMQSQGRGPGGVGQAVREAWGLSGQEEDRDPRDVCEAPGPHTGGGWRRSPAGRGVVPGEEGFLDTWHPDRARLRSGRRDCHPPAAAPDAAATPAHPCLAASCPETRTSDRERSTATGEPCGR